MNINIKTGRQWVQFWGLRGDLESIYSIDPDMLFIVPIGTVFDVIHAPTQNFGTTHKINLVWSKYRYEVVMSESFHSQEPMRAFRRKAVRALDSDEITTCIQTVNAARKIAQSAIQRELGIVRQREQELEVA